MTKAAGFGNRWDDLAKNGLATTFEIQQIKRNEALLSLIRARLHVIANRREDRLVFDLQTAVAATFGYVGESQRKASEALMRRYYWAAKAVTQLNQILLLNIAERLQPQAEEPTPINERFFEKGGLIEVASDDLYIKDPHAILETFLLYQKTIGVNGLSARTLRALYNARHVMDSKFRNDRVNHVTFMRDAAAAARHHACAAADEPDLGAGALPARVPQHRRADAARPVPRLHGRPAHPDGAAQRAALLHRRACARIPVLLAARGRLGQAVDPVHRRAVPRHRQGPRRRPFDAGRARRAALLPPARDCARRRQADRVPGRANTW